MRLHYRYNDGWPVSSQERMIQVERFLFDFFRSRVLCRFKGKCVLSLRDRYFHEFMISNPQFSSRGTIRIESETVTVELVVERGGSKRPVSAELVSALLASELAEFGIIVAVPQPA